MRILTLSSLLALLTLSAFRCNKEADSGTCYKGKLVKAGYCMNYTVSVLSGNMDASKIEAAWLNPADSTVYTNAFRLLSTCTFPANIKEGDTFYFKLVNNSDMGCNVCLAYYPTPQKALQIEVLSGPCP